MAKPIRLAMWVRLVLLGLMVLDTVLPVPWSQPWSCGGAHPHALASETAWQLLLRKDEVMFWVGGGVAVLGVLWRLEAWEGSLRWIRLALPLLSGLMAGAMALSAALHDLFGPCFFGHDGERSRVGIDLMLGLAVGTMALSTLTLVLRAVELWRRGRPGPAASAGISSGNR